MSSCKNEIYYEEGLKLYADYELVNRLWKKEYKISFQPVTVANYLLGGLSSQISWEARKSKFQTVSKSYGAMGLIRVILERFNLLGYKAI